MQRSLENKPLTSIRCLDRREGGKRDFQGGGNWQKVKKKKKKLATFRFILQNKWGAGGSGHHSFSK